MNIVNKLTLRQLKLNRKRTLVTIIGTIISAAMITAVATLALSFMDLVQRQTIESFGEWHVQYKEVNQEQLKAITSDKETKTAMMSRDLGYAYLEGSQNQNKPYLYVKEYSKEAYDNFPIKLSSGRLPEKPDEVVISEEIASNAKVGYKLGDVLQLKLGKRKSTNPELKDVEMLQNYSMQWEEDERAEYLTEDTTKSYKIVGTIKRPFNEYTWSPGYTIFSYLDENTVTPEEHFDVIVTVKHINNKLFEHVEQFVDKNEIKSFSYNTDLLRYYGVIKDDEVRGMLFTLSAIIMIIIMIGSISLIYNAFAISVSERSRYLGMLSSVGATKKQKRNSVFFEGGIIGVISIPIGIIAGHVGLAITYILINPIVKNAFNATVGFRVVVFPSTILVAVLVSISTILISTYIPARRASNISAIDAIRQTFDVKITRRQVKTSILTRKIFGIEGELGLKNLKRNKKRYKATVFSLIISMVLFLVVTSFTGSLKKAFMLAQDGYNFDIEARIYEEEEEIKDEIAQKISALDEVNEGSRIDKLEASSLIDGDFIGEQLEKQKDEFLIDGKYPYQVYINVLDEKALQKYAKEIDVDYSRLNQADQPSAIVINTVKYKDEKADKYVETKVVKTKVGDELPLSITDPDTSEKSDLLPVTVAGLTAEMPMGIMSSGEGAVFHIIISKDAFHRITEGNKELVSKLMYTNVYLTSDNPLKLQENIEELQNNYGVSKLSFFNIYANRQMEQQMLLVLNIFTYAFIILITAICIANIINTISTSIAMRKREFAMLKSVGITPQGFNKMLNYESIFYGLKALLYGLPISFAVKYLIYEVLMTSFNFDFTFPLMNIIIVIVSVFVIVGLAMLYSGKKVKKDNIIDALKQDIT